MKKTTTILRSLFAAILISASALLSAQDLFNSFFNQEQAFYDQEDSYTYDGIKWNFKAEGDDVQLDFLDTYDNVYGNKGTTITGAEKITLSTSDLAGEFYEVLLEAFVESKDDKNTTVTVMIDGVVYGSPYKLMGYVESGSGWNYYPINPNVDGKLLEILIDNPSKEKVALTKTIVSVVKAMSAPVADKTPGEYDEAITVTLSQAEGRGILYTLDGSKPNLAFANDNVGPTFIYSNPIEITKTTTVKAVAFNSGVGFEEYSEVVEFEYIINSNEPIVVASPKANIQSNSEDSPFKTEISLQLSAEAGCKIFYTLDETDPSDEANENRKEYSASIRLSENTTLKAVAVLGEGEEAVYSEVVTFTYYFDIAAPIVAAPEANPAAGSYNDTVFVELTAGEGCKIFYTLDGTDPSDKANENVQEYESAIKLYSDTILKAVAVLGEGSKAVYSEVAEFEYKIDIKSSVKNVTINFDVYAKDGAVVVETQDADALIEVFSVTGRRVAAVRAASDVTVIGGINPGVAVVRVNGVAAKVVVE